MGRLQNSHTQEPQWSLNFQSCPEYIHWVSFQCFNAHCNVISTLCFTSLGSFFVVAELVNTKHKCVLEMLTRYTNWEWWMSTFKLRSFLLCSSSKVLQNSQCIHLSISIGSFRFAINRSLWVGCCEWAFKDQERKHICICLDKNVSHPLHTEYFKFYTCVPLVRTAFYHRTALAITRKTSLRCTTELPSNCMKVLTFTQ